MHSKEEINVDSVDRMYVRVNVSEDKTAVEVSDDMAFLSEPEFVFVERRAVEGGYFENIDYLFFVFAEQFEDNKFACVDE